MRDSNPRSPEPQSGALTNYANPTIKGRYRSRLSTTVLAGIRTLDLRLRRPLLYPAELRTHFSVPNFGTKRVMGIEPTYPAWKAGVLPLNYTRISDLSFSIQVGVTGFEPATSWSQTRRSSQTEPHPVFGIATSNRDARNIICTSWVYVNNIFQLFLFF